MLTANAKLAIPVALQMRIHESMTQEENRLLLSKKTHFRVDYLPCPTSSIVGIVRDLVRWNRYAELK